MTGSWRNHACFGEFFSFGVRDCRRASTRTARRKKMVTATARARFQRQRKHASDFTLKQETKPVKNRIAKKSQHPQIDGFDGHFHFPAWTSRTRNMSPPGFLEWRSVPWVNVSWAAHTLWLLWLLLSVVGRSDHLRQRQRQASNLPMCPPFSSCPSPP